MTQRADALAHSNSVRYGMKQLRVRIEQMDRGEATRTVAAIIRGPETPAERSIRLDKLITAIPTIGPSKYTQLCRRADLRWGVARVGDLCATEAARLATLLDGLRIGPGDDPRQQRLAILQRELCRAVGLTPAQALRAARVAEAHLT